MSCFVTKAMSNIVSFTFIDLEVSQSSTLEKLMAS